MGEQGHGAGSSSGSGTALAVILARGGSKGLPRKNALPVAGRPCIAWTIEAALGAGSVGAVVVSTDDAEIAGIARGLGANVIDRPPALAGDTASVDDAARHAVRLWDGHSGAGGVGKGGPVVILYANVPVRPATLIDDAVGLLITKGADSVQSYQPVGKHHPWWTARVDSVTGAVRPWEGEVLNHGCFRRQDLPPAFIPDGGVICVTRSALMLELDGVLPGPHAFFGREHRRLGVINPEGSVVDIDSGTDLLVAGAVLSRRNSA